MTAKEAILYSLESTMTLTQSYLADLSDEDILIRPAPTANHIAWQLGHLIQSEIHLLKLDLPGLQYPALPAGFAQQHSNATCGSTTGFLKKDEYVALFEKVRNGTMTIVRILPDDELSKPSEGPLAGMAPTVGTLCLLLAHHTLMHGGQFTVVRRAIGKPVLF